jgi:reductive dehalogenase
MKGLGLAGAGLGAAAASAPVFHDLDETTGSSKALRQLPWYVKQVDEPPPPLEIDYNILGGVDRRGQPSRPTMGNISYIDYFNNMETWCAQQFPPYKAGGTVRDRALHSSTFASWRASYTPRTITDSMRDKSNPSYNPGYECSPEEYGMPKWQGTPEENLKTLRSALRMLGVCDVMAVEINDKTKKFIYAYDSRRKIVWEDVDEPYTTTDKRVYPNKYKWVIFWNELQPTELTRRCPQYLGRAGFQQSYTRIKVITLQLQHFLKALGYGYCSLGAAPSAGWGILAGSTEHVRMGTSLASPIYGPKLRGMYRTLTDLPLAPTKPIDAGMGRFCETCKICAEMCPFEAISFGDPTWEAAGGPAFNAPLTGDKATDCRWNIPGYKGWRLDYSKCLGNCCSCQGACPFGAEDQSWVHTLVKGTIATTSLFNGFFANMSRTFDYGQHDAESWWNLEDKPLYGIHPAFIPQLV